MFLCFFGAYDPSYPRTAILLRGLKLIGEKLYEWRLPQVKSWIRYPLGLSQAPFKLGQVPKRACFFVPAFGHKDVPLAFMMARLRASQLIFDPLASRYETKIIDWQRRSPNSWAARWNYWLDHWTMKLADLVLADTQIHGQYYCHEFGLKASQVAVLPVGFNDSLWRHEPSQEVYGHKPFTAVFFGSFLPLHGVDRLAEAALLVNKREPSIRFLFIGQGQTFPLVKRIIARSESEKIQFLGWLNEKDLAKVVSQEADLCFGLFGQTPKAQRVVPHKIFQSMAIGKPVMTLDTPAVREFFTHGENIYLCPSGEPEVIASGIIELYYERDRREKIAQNGYKLVWNKFTPSALARSLISLLEAKYKWT